MKTGALKRFAFSFLPVLLALGVLGVPEASAAISRVEVVTGTPGTHMALGTSTTLGELIVVFACEGEGGATQGSVTDSGSQTYTQISTLSGLGSHYVCSLWYVQNSAASVSWINVSTGSGENATYEASWVAHYTGVATSGALDQTTPLINTNSTSWASSPIPVNCTGELLIGADFNDDNGSFDSPTLASSGSWSTMSTELDGADDVIGFADWIGPTLGNQQFTGTGTGGAFNLTGIASFKSATSSCGVVLDAVGPTGGGGTAGTSGSSTWTTFSKSWTHVTSSANNRLLVVGAAYSATSNDLATLSLLTSSGRSPDGGT